MNGFFEGGAQAYAEALLAEMKLKQEAIERRLAAATTTEEEAQLREEIQRLLSEYNGKQRDLRYSLF